MDTSTVILGTAGHIDHGKTALVRALTGVDTDRLPEEKARGITIDIGFARLDLPGVGVAIVDVPGHERFVRNMLAGASGIDIAMLVVAADDSIMPQTCEHLAILRLLGLSRGVVAITKCDMVDEAWVSLVEDEVRRLVQGTFLQGRPVVRTSAVTRRGVDALAEAIGAESASVAKERAQEPFRLAIDRSFLVRGVGTVVTGTVWSGGLERDDEVEWLPNGQRLRVKGLQAHGRPVDRVARGERAAVGLVGVHHSEIRRGHELAEPGALTPTRLVTVRLDVLEEAPRALRHRSRVRLHIGTAEVPASVRLLEGTSIEPGSRGMAQLVCAEPIVARVGQAMIVRSESPVFTLGGGRVLLAAARPVRRRDADALALLERVEDGDPTVRAAASIALLGTRLWVAADLWQQAGVDRADAPRIVDTLVESGVVLSIGSRGASPMLPHRDVVAGLAERVASVLRRRHDAEPDRATQPRERVVSDLAYLPTDVVQGVLDSMIGAGRVVGDSAEVALTEFQPRVPDRARMLERDVAMRIADAGFAPPASDELAATLGAAEPMVRAALASAVRAGELVHIGGGWHLSAANARELRSRVLELLTRHGSITVSQIRDALGTSRKYAVPLCEYLDRTGITRRRGDSRVVGPRGSAEATMPTQEGA